MLKKASTTGQQTDNENEYVKPLKEKTDPFAKGRELAASAVEPTRLTELKTPKSWSVTLKVWDMGTAIQGDLGAELVGEIDTHEFLRLSECLEFVAKTIKENYPGLPDSFEMDVVKREGSFRSMLSRASGNTLFRQPFQSNARQYLATADIQRV